MRKNPLTSRAAGLLLHPTSLPGPLPVGDLGPGARAFVDFLNASGQSIWQMLPIHPVGGGYSPYDSPSAFAGFSLLVSLEDLAAEGLLLPGEVPRVTHQPIRADYAAAFARSEPALRLAHERFKKIDGGHLLDAYRGYLDHHASWVWDFALYSALKARFGGQSWTEWPEDLRHRNEQALANAHREFREEISYHIFVQFCFDRQWNALRAYANERAVRLLGDIPMFVAHDSVDVWANQGMFFLDAEGRRLVQAGVPPDYFSEDGQLWGNPIYRWERMQADGYGWWIDRLRKELERFDAVRLDHFIAFSRYWEVPMGVADAKGGRYVSVPGHDFFEKAGVALGGLPLIAEDLGIVTREVEELRDRFSLPGMKILQFAFAPGAESYLPHRHDARTVVYAGTHDNNTTRGFFETLKEKRREDPSLEIEYRRVVAFAGTDDPEAVTWNLIRALYGSPSNTAILQVQDILNLDGRFRMNVPGIAEGNWNYRLEADALARPLAERLRALTEITERLPKGS